MQELFLDVLFGRRSVLTVSSWFYNLCPYCPFEFDSLYTAEEELGWMA